MVRLGTAPGSILFPSRCSGVVSTCATRRLAGPFRYAYRFNFDSQRVLDGFCRVFYGALVLTSVVDGLVDGETALRNAPLGLLANYPATGAMVVEIHVDGARPLDLAPVDLQLDKVALERLMLLGHLVSAQRKSLDRRRAATGSVELIDGAHGVLSHLVLGLGPKLEPRVRVAETAVREDRERGVEGT